MINKNDYQRLTTLESITLKGDYINKTIWINGMELNPALSKETYLHSESGFDWGCHEGGSAQLALAVLLEITKNKRLSIILHHVFKIDFIAKLPKSNFETTINIGAWFKNIINEDFIL